MTNAPKLLGTDTLRTAYPKLNTAIDNSNSALTTANTAKSTADTAKTTADTALANSENTQTQLDTVVINGDSSVEAAQARVAADGSSYTTLQERLNSSDVKLAENTQHLDDNSVSVEKFPLINPEVDDTGRIQRALNTGRNVLFAQGKTYISKKITPVGNQALIGYHSTLRFKDGETGEFVDIRDVSNVDIIGLTIDGGDAKTHSLASVKGTRKGISIVGNSLSQTVKSINIDMCTIKGFDSEGVYVSYVGFQEAHGMAVKVANTDVSNCYTGINLGERAEYCHIVNVSCVKSRVGFSTVASNTFATNLHCSDNVDGIHLHLLSGNNDSHSGFANCSFNHNSNYAIYAKDFTVGISMVGCHAHANGSIFLENCSGFRFQGGEIRSTNIDIDGGGFNTFRDNLVQTVTVTHAKNGNADQTEFINNTAALESAVLSGLLNTSNYYIDRTVSTTISGITTETNVLYNNTVAQFLFGQQNTSIYDLTGVGVFKQKGIHSIFANLAVKNSGTSDNSVELAIYKGSSRIKRETFLIKAGATQFIDTSVVNVFEANDTWKVTIKANSGSIDVLGASEAHLFVQKIEMS